jgi:Rieske 2Fe-2S family protein
MPVLPVEAYTSQEWFDKEQRIIFGNSWQFAGLVEDIQDAGDYVTVQCGVQNIFVVKGRDQKLRAFHNICRHRGTQLLRAVGKKQKALTCPYHDWTYSLNGELISVPEQKEEFPDLELDKLCLHKASVDIWRGMIWVHPNPDAEPITQWFKGCWEYLAPYDPTRLIEYPDMVYEKVIKANWKIVAENFMDVYHLSHLHSNTLQMYNHANAKYHWEGNHYMFYEPLSSDYFKNLDQLLPAKRIKEMSDEVIGAYVPWLFPNFGLSETEAMWSTFHAIPLAPDKTKVIVRSKFEETSNWEYVKQSTKSYMGWSNIRSMNTTKYGKAPDKNSNDPMEWNDVMEEDAYVCEAQQKALNNPLFSVGATAQHGESTIRMFQSIVKRWMEEK